MYDLGWGYYAMDVNDGSDEVIAAAGSVVDAVRLPGCAVHG